MWFGKRDSQDLEARERFGVFVDQALAGELTEWAQRPEGWLALVLLLDQLPRMIFRDTPKAFSGDLRAQKLVAQGIAADFDRQLKPIQRVFIYLVFEHCENLAVQNEAVSRFIDLVAEQPEGGAGGVCRQSGLCRAASEGDCAVWPVSASQCGVGAGVYG